MRNNNIKINHSLICHLYNFANKAFKASNTFLSPLRSLIQAISPTRHNQNLRAKLYPLTMRQELKGHIRNPIRAENKGF